MRAIDVEAREPHLLYYKLTDKTKHPGGANDTIALQVEYAKQIDAQNRYKEKDQRRNDRENKSQDNKIDINLAAAELVQCLENGRRGEES